MQSHVDIEVFNPEDGLKLFVGDLESIRDELGDLLFSVAQWGRHLGQFPEEAMRACCTRFASRFEGVEELVRDSGREIADCTLQELEEAWQEAKNR